VWGGGGWGGWGGGGVGGGGGAGRGGGRGRGGTSPSLPPAAKLSKRTRPRLVPATIDDVESAALDIAHIRSGASTRSLYTPANQALDGSYRSIRVTAKGSEKFSVRARAGYVAAADR